MAVRKALCKATRHLLMRTSPLVGIGVGTSFIWSTETGPGVSHTIAFIIFGSEAMTLEIITIQQ